jgi:predicted metal-dependent phosphoesterase TrpH
MMISFDLHIHSDFSDGSLPTGELVLLAHKLGLTTIALTDHDTMGGVPDIIAQGKKEGITVLPGVEMSAWHNGHSLHILGYGLHQDHPGLVQGLQTIQAARRARNMAMLEKLQALGISLNPLELAGMTRDQVGRPHLARLLLKKNIVRSFDEAFARFLGQDAKAYVARKKFPAAEAIRLITDAGGLAMLAHPTSFDRSLNNLPQVLAELQAIGLAGLEVFYPSYSLRTCSRLVELAGQHGLLISGGSDFHGQPSWQELLDRMKIPFPEPHKLLYWTENLMTSTTTPQRG